MTGSLVGIDYFVELLCFFFPHLTLRQDSVEDIFERIMVYVELYYLLDINATSIVQLANVDTMANTSDYNVSTYIPLLHLPYCLSVSSPFCFSSTAGPLSYPIIRGETERSDTRMLGWVRTRCLQNSNQPGVYLPELNATPCCMNANLAASVRSLSPPKWNPTLQKSYCGLISSRAACTLHTQTQTPRKNAAYWCQENPDARSHALYGTDEWWRQMRTLPSPQRV